MLKDLGGTVAGGGGYAFVEVRVNNLCETLDDVIADNCLALEADSNCELQEEFVDGVQTYRSFNPTSNTPPPRYGNRGLDNG